MNKKIIISREESQVFHKMRIIPLHPLVYSEFQKNNNSLDYSIMNESLDGALKWTYEDLKSEPQLEKLLTQSSNFLQDSNSEKTTDIQVIEKWLEKKHEYFKIENGHVYSSEDQKKFPIKGLTLKHDGIYIGMCPIIIAPENIQILEHTAKHFNLTELINKEKLNSYKISQSGRVFNVPGFWYTKDGSEQVKFFGKNFAINYTNRLIEKHSK